MDYTATSDTITDSSMNIDSKSTEDLLKDIPTSTSNCSVTSSANAGYNEMSFSHNMYLPSTSQYSPDDTRFLSVTNNASTSYSHDNQSASDSSKKKKKNKNNSTSSWREEKVFDRIDYLATPKDTYPAPHCSEYMSQWTAASGDQKVPEFVPPPREDGKINFANDPNTRMMEALTRPNKKCGEWVGKRHCDWECDYANGPEKYCKDGKLDPNAVDWNKHNYKKGPCPPPDDGTFQVSKAALNAVATRRLEKLAVPKKVVDSDEYYLWLLHRKPDVDAKLESVKKLCLDKIDLTNERIFLRCDLDYTQPPDIKTKLAKILPSVQYCLDKNCKAVIIASHCGDPKGKRDPKYTLKPVAKEFECNLGREVVFLDDCIGPEAQALCEDPEPGSLFVLENLRFYPEEEGHYIDDTGSMVPCTKEDVQKFRSKLFNLGDIYVQDAFNNLVHMTNTTVGSNKQERAHGFNIKKELEKYNNHVIKPKKPMVAVVGGSLKDKIDIVYNIMGKADEILLGGEIAQIFLKTLKGNDIGVTQSSPAKEKKVLNCMSRAKDIGCVVNLPSDFVVRNTKKPDEYFSVSTKLDIEPWFEIVDIGKMTRSSYVKTIREAVSVVWIGDMGLLLDGTSEISDAISEATEQGKETFIMDEDTHASFKKLSKGGKVTDITGDGKVTSMLLHKKMPKGLAALSPYQKKIKKRQTKEETASSKPDSIDKQGFRMESGFNKLCIHTLDVEDKRVLVLTDLTVPVSNNMVMDNYNVRMVVPTVKWVLKRGARMVILLSPVIKHDKKKNENQSLKPVCEELRVLLNRDVVFVPECSKRAIMRATQAAHPGSVLLVENLNEEQEEHYTFNMEHRGSGRPQPPDSVAQFCQDLSSVCDIYVNDAFSLLDRNSSSVTGCMQKEMPCGFLVKNELKYLAKTFNKPPRKFLAIIGGNRTSKALEHCKGLLRDIDELILVGSLGLHALWVEQGMRLGLSYDRNINKADVESVLDLARKNKVRVYFPVDLVTSTDINNDRHCARVSTSQGISPGEYFVDIGPKTCSLFKRVIKRTKLVLWFGVCGLCTLPEFKKGTREVYNTITDCTENPEIGLVSIVGGPALSKFVHMIDPNHEGLSHVTTGISVALRLLSEKTMPGLDAISYNTNAKVKGINRMNWDQADIKDKRVLLRTDFKLPIKGGPPDDQEWINVLLNTIKALFKKGATCVTLCGHIGEPEGRKEELLSLSPIKAILEKKLRQEIQFFDQGVTDAVEAALRSPTNGSVAMLENLRFNPEEKGYQLNTQDARINIAYDQIEAYRTRLSKLGDVYITESFDGMHTNDSSVVGVKATQNVLGPTLKKELGEFSKVLGKIQGPIVAIVGGSETYQMVEMMYRMVDFCTDIIVIGNPAYTFLKMRNVQIGKTEFDRHATKIIPRLLKKAQMNSVNIHLPVDFKVPSSQEESAEEEEPNPPEVFSLKDGIPEMAKAMDIGPKSVDNFVAIIQEAKTILYTGRAGTCWMDPFNEGTVALIEAIKTQTEEEGAISIAFGAKSGMCLTNIEASAGFSMISQGSRLIVDLIKGHPLPGIHNLNTIPMKPLPVMSLEHMTIKGKKVLLRLDLNVPTVEGVVLDTDKIEASIATIKYILEKQPAAVILAGFRGNPKGYKNAYLSMEPLCLEFEHFLEVPVKFLDTPCSRKSRMALEDPEPSSVFLLENLKFYPAEVGQDEEVLDILEPDVPAVVSAKNEPNNSRRASSINFASKKMSTSSHMEELYPDVNIDKLMYQVMEHRTVDQYTREIGDLAEVFIQDDVTHMWDTLISNQGFELPTRGIGYQLMEHLRTSQDLSDQLKSPAVSILSPAPKE